MILIILIHRKNHVIIIAYHLYIYPSRRTPKNAIFIDTKNVIYNDDDTNINKNHKWQNENQYIWPCWMILLSCDTIYKFYIYAKYAISSVLFKNKIEYQLIFHTKTLLFCFEFIKSWDYICMLLLCV